MVTGEWEAVELRLIHEDDRGWVTGAQAVVRYDPNVDGWTFTATFQNYTIHGDKCIDSATRAKSRADEAIEWLLDLDSELAKEGIEW
jgi:hypothetical protein